jgi:pilus assembly protein CpaE
MPQETSGSLGSTHLLAFLSDAESAGAVHAALRAQSIREYRIEPGTAVDAAAHLKHHASPHWLIVEVTSAEEAPAQLDALADVVHPSTRVIVTGHVDSFSFYHWLIGLGIHDYLLLPFSESRVAAALLKNTGGTNGTKPDGAPAARKLIALIGTRGGMGTTTIATTLAGIFAESAPTALVDLDPHFGSAALALDLEPGRGIRDALEKPDRIDALFLERVMVKAENQLSVFAAEENLSESISANAQAGELLHAALREKFSYIIVDVPRHLTPLTRHFLKEADHTILVTESSIFGLRDTLRLRDLVVDHWKRAAPLVFVNREGYAPKQSLVRSDFTKHLGATPALYLPYVPEVTAATARGEPLLKDVKAGTFVAPLRYVAGQLSGKKTAKEDKPKAAGLLGHIMKGKS